MTIKDVDLLEFYGEKNIKLKKLESFFPDLNILSRGDTLKIIGDKRDTQRAKKKIETMIKWLKEKEQLSIQDIEKIVKAKNNSDLIEDVQKISKYLIVHGRNGKPIKAKTKNQMRMVDCSNENDICFAIGPAGTGKTYTAVALAVKALKTRQVERIVLCRPAVEAGESLGFLPGDLKEKIDPYLRPLYDALNDMIPREKLEQLTERNTIEVAPLAFMRGRTLDRAFIILDEAQNATSTQLKMFLTRLGPSAKCIITGDLTQIDLPRSGDSGLNYTLNVLKGVKGIGLIELGPEDVVRHRLVKDIILAFAGIKSKGKSYAKAINKAKSEEE